MTETLTREQYLAEVAPKKRGNKYGAKRVKHQGQSFDSIAELNRFLLLQDMEKKGEISHLARQPRFDLTVNGNPVVYRPSGRQAFYKADFIYFCKGRNVRVIEDVKGFATREFMLKRAFVEATFPGVIIEVVK